MPLPSFRSRLKDKRPFYSIFTIIPAVEVVEIVGLSGFDGVILDIEHGAHQSESLGKLILAARAREIYPIVRARSSDVAQLNAALDAGAAGVIVPQIGSAAEALRVARSTRFSPDGNRGANPFVRAADFSGRQEFFAEANRDVAVMLMIEGAGAIAEMEEIVATPNIDGIFIGPMDLSHALGVPGEMTHPKVVEQIEKVIDACAARGIISGIYASSAEVAKRWMGRGVTYVGVSVDTFQLLSAMKKLAGDLRA
jgi:4-hydroxy-2-oxoheptanedioate aldolase